MSYVAEIFERMPFFLQRILLGVGCTVNHYLPCLYLDALPLSETFGKYAANGQSSSCGDKFQLLFGEFGNIDHYLNVIDGRAVIEGDETHVFVSSASSDPTFYIYLIAEVSTLQGSFYHYPFHIASIFYFLQKNEWQN